MGQKMVKIDDFWPIGHFLPTFKNKSGQQEMAQPCGFAGFCGHFPTFFLILHKEK